MLSAGRLKINELRNKVTELTVQLANVQSENKQLMRQQRQQVTVSYLPYTLNASPLELAQVHQFGNFYLRIAPMGGDRLLVNTAHFSVPATYLQSLKLS